MEICLNRREPNIQTFREPKAGEFHRGSVCSVLSLENDTLQDTTNSGYYRFLNSYVQSKMVSSLFNAPIPLQSTFTNTFYTSQASEFTTRFAEFDPTSAGRTDGDTSLLHPVRQKDVLLKIISELRIWGAA